ncbi:hypothetical protein GCM10010452_48090 [Crossiella cryophila]
MGWVTAGGALFGGWGGAWALAFLGDVGLKRLVAGAVIRTSVFWLFRGLVFEGGVGGGLVGGAVLGGEVVGVGGRARFFGGGGNLGWGADRRGCGDIHSGSVACG